jgi:uncharacterized YccA/Bax inhibitor family protein
MALFKTSNPALGQNTFSNLAAQPGSLIDVQDRMTLNGTVNKTGLLLLCAIATARLDMAHVSARARHHGMWRR